MQRADVERLREALTDPSRLSEDRRTAEARFLLVSHVLAGLGRALDAARCDALLAKGAALAQTVYPQPWQREMADIDLIARPGEVDRVLGALEAGGLIVEPRSSERPITTDQLGERRTIMRFGGINMAVEVHSRLDKVVGRSVDYAAMFRRAVASPTNPRLLLPDPIDQILLVVIHLSNSDFDHDVGWVDLELLLRGHIDVDELLRRVRGAKLETAMWLSLLSLEALGSSSVPARVLRVLEPSTVRMRALSKRFRPGAFPPRQAGNAPTGWSWVVAQTPLRDDLVRWALGIARYATSRTIERVITARE